MSWVLRVTNRKSPKGKELYLHNFFGGGIKTFGTKQEAEAFIKRVERSNLEPIEVELKKKESIR